MTSDIQLKAGLIQDSRGRETVSVRLTLDNVSTVGDVPAGASTGEDEALTVDARVAVNNIEEHIEPMLRKLNLDLSEHESLIAMEAAMADMAGTNCGNLGANAIVPVSRALWRAAAKLNKMELYAYIRKYCCTSTETRPVRFFMNIFRDFFKI